MSKSSSGLNTPLYVQVLEKGEPVFAKVFDRLPITIGRGLHNDISLPDYRWISRSHAIILAESGRICLVDMNSANGVALRGQKFAKIFVKDGLEVELGSLRIKFAFQKVEEKSVRPNLDDTQVIKTEPQFKDEDPKPYPTLPDEPVPVVQTQCPVVKKARAHVKTDEDPDDVKTEILHSSNDLLTSHRATRAGLLNLDVSAQDYLKLSLPRSDISEWPRSQLALEATVSWKGVIYDSRICRRGENLTVGTSAKGVYIPTIPGEHVLARFTSSGVVCQLPRSAQGTLHRSSGPVQLHQHLLHRPAVAGDLVEFTLHTTDALTLDLDGDLRMHLRYSPSPRQLAKKPLKAPDRVLKKAAVGSSVVHFALVLMSYLTSPRVETTKSKPMAPRVAKLLMPKQEPKVEKKTPPPPPEVAMKKPIQPLPPKTRTQKVEKRVAKRPSLPSSPQPPQSKPKDIHEVGALAALGALNPVMRNPSHQPVAININPNAGGAEPSLNTTGMIGSLKTSTGRLPSSTGMVGVKTKGMGYGTGTGYGVQGLKGTAGKRGVAGAVLGPPKLMNIERSEGLTQKQVMDEVKKHVGKIQQCYETALLSEPSLAGLVEYEWFITPSGQVKWVKVKKSEMTKGDQLNRCVEKVFNAMKFPSAKNGESTQPSIGFPFGRL